MFDRAARVTAQALDQLAWAPSLDNELEWRWDAGFVRRPTIYPVTWSPAPEV